MIERGIGIREFGSILNKPNQLIEINRCKLTDLQSSSIDLFLHEYQTSIFVLEETGKSYKELFDINLEIPLSIFIKKVKGGKYEIKNLKWLDEELRKLTAIQIETFSKYKFRVLNILQFVEYDTKLNVIRFQLANEIVKALASETKLIENYENDTVDVDSFYTSYNYVSLNSYNLTANERGLYENILQQKWHLYKYSKNTMVCGIQEFLLLIGISSENMSYCKRRIKDIISNIEKKTKMELEYFYDTGKYNQISKIHIRIKDFDNSKNREIIEFLKSDKVEKFEYKDNKNVYVDYFEIEENNKINIGDEK